MRREWTPVPVNTHLTEQSCNTPTRPFADLKLTEAEMKSRRYKPYLHYNLHFQNCVVFSPGKFLDTSKHTRFSWQTAWMLARGPGFESQLSHNTFSSL